MKYSEERISHLTHQALNDLWNDDLIDFSDESLARQEILQAMETIFSFDDQIDMHIREKLSKQRKVPGSKEWQILYEKYHAEECNKRGW